MLYIPGEPFHGRICPWCARHTFDWEAEKARVWATSAWVCALCRTFLSGTEADDAPCLQGVVKAVLCEDDWENYHWQHVVVAPVLPG